MSNKNLPVNANNRKLNDNENYKLTAECDMIMDDNTCVSIPNDSLMIRVKLCLKCGKMYPNLPIAIVTGTMFSCITKMVK